MRLSSLKRLEVIEVISLKSLSCNAVLALSRFDFSPRWPEARVPRGVQDRPTDPPCFQLQIASKTRLHVAMPFIGPNLFRNTALIDFSAYPQLEVSNALMV